MNTKEIEAQITLLKDKAIDKVDYYFNEFVLEDVYDIGGIDYLIGEDDWYNYYLNLYNEINELIKDVVNTNIETNKKKDLLQKCISIKRIIDKQLVNNPNYIYESFNDDPYNLKKYNKELSCIELIEKNEELAKKIIETLYFELDDLKIIECTNKNEFIKHFIPNSNNYKPIKWVGSQRFLVKLIQELIDNKILSQSYTYTAKWEMVITHFIKKNGSLFKSDVLRSTLSTLLDEEYKNEKVAHLIIKIKKITDIM